MLIVNNLSQVICDMFAPDGIFTNIGLSDEFEKLVDETLTNTSQHKSRKFWFMFLKDAQKATRGHNVNAYLCVSYILALELDSTLFQAEVFSDNHHSGVIAHASGSDSISVALYGRTCYFLNGFTRWSQYKNSAHNDTVLDFDLFSYYEGFEAGSRGLEFGAFGKVETVLDMALMLMTGSHKPVKL